jgi:hypothetical protein
MYAAASIESVAATRSQVIIDGGRCILQRRCVASGQASE